MRAKPEYPNSDRLEAPKGADECRGEIGPATKTCAHNSGRKTTVKCGVKTSEIFFGWYVLNELFFFWGLKPIQTSQIRG